MSQALHIHIGGAGVMIGSSLWKLYQKEQKDAQDKNYCFQQIQQGECPRVLFADLDDRMINQIKQQKICDFKPESFQNGKEDAGNNYCRGHYTIGKELVDQCLDQLRKQSEACDKVNQIIITSSLSGGTGSGFFSLLIERLSVDYQKVSKNSFLLYPSHHMSNNCVDMYNAVLSTHATLEHCDSVIMFDNESMYNVLKENIDLDYVDYSHLNNLVAQVISTYTGVQRFNKQNSQTILSTQVPYPRLHYFVPSYGPIIDVNDYHALDSRYTQGKVQLIMKRNAQLYKCELKPRCLSQALISRGLNQDQFFGKFDTSLQQLHYYEQKTELFQCNSKNYQIIPQLSELKKTQTLLSNDSAVHKELDKLCFKYDTIYAKRAFVHWFVGEGCESGEMSECREDLAALVKDYEEMYYENGIEAVEQE